MSLGTKVRLLYYDIDIIGLKHENNYAAHEGEAT